MPNSNDTTLNTGNIVTGSAFLFQGAIGAVLPTIPATDNFVSDFVQTINAGNVWKALGYSDAGVKFSYEPTYKDITVDESLSPVDNVMTAEKLVISMGMAEITLNNLTRSISTAAAPVATAAAAGLAGLLTFQHGGQQVTQKFSYLIVGQAPEGFIRVVNVYRAVASSKLDMQYRRGEKIVTPVEFTSLALSSNAIGNQLFQISDKTSNGL